MEAQGVGLVLEELERYGLLLRSDARLPNVAGLIAGEPVRGSWWGHPRGQDIYRVVDALDDRSDVLVAKLVSGKETYVHRRLWGAVAAVGSARERWQIEGLSVLARRMLEAVSRDGELRTDAIPPRGGEKPGEAARELERRLLVHGSQFHTESGAHAKRLETWQRWAQRVGFRSGEMTPEEGKRALEEAVRHLNERFEGKGRLPWG